MKINKILVSQPQPTTGKSPYFDIAEKYGIEVVFRPFVKVEGIPAKDFRKSKINLADYTAVIFSSKAAVDNYFRLSEEMRFTIPDTMKYFCTSESIALYLQKYIVYRKRKIFFGKTGKIDDTQLLQALHKNIKENFLFPVSDVHKDNLSSLDKQKITYTKATMFRTVSNDFTEDEPFDYDMLLFFSPSGVASLMKNFPDFKDNKKHVMIGTLGDTTAKAVTDAGLTLTFAAPTPQAPSMAAALELFIKNNK